MADKYVPKYNSKHDSARSDMYYHVNVKKDIKKGECVFPVSKYGPHSGEVEFHHTNYDDPTKGIWVCRGHHSLLRRKKIIEAIKKFLPKN